MAAINELNSYDGLALAELVKNKEVTPGELVEASIAQIEPLNPRINAVIHKTYDLAREAAQGELPDGAFKGVPFLLKDLVADCAGVPTRSGSRFHRHFVPDHDLYNDHVLTRSVRDSAAILDATAGPDVGAPYYAPPPSRPHLDEVTTEPGRLRIAYSGKPIVPGSVHADCLKGLEVTARLCQELGHEVVEAAPEIDAQAFASAFLRMVCVETRATIDEASIGFGRKATSRDFEAATWALGLLGTKIPAPEFASAVRYLKRSSRQVGRFFQEYDLLLTSTLGRPPVLRGELRLQGYEALALKVLSRLNAARLLDTALNLDKLAGRLFEFVPFSVVFNATGQPAMSVPLHWNDAGLPIGMQFVGRYGDEALLFRLAGQLERGKPWFDRVPPLCNTPKT